ncbi:hypothetical protein D3C81_519790 [compost metagenome]
MLVDARLARVVDQLIALGRQVQQPETALLVRVRQPAPVRRRVQFPAVVIALRRQLLALARAIGRIFPDLIFTARVDDGEDGFLVAGKDGVARPRPFGNGDIDAALAARAGDADTPPRRQDDALILAGQLHVGERVQRRADLARALLVEVGYEADGQRLRLAGAWRGQVEHMQIRAQLIHDLAVAQLRIAHVPLRVGGQGAAVGTVRQHAPQIVAAAFIADVVHAALPPHGALVVAGQDGGILVHGHGFSLAAQVVAPQGGMRAAPVVAHIVIRHGQAETREIQGGACIVEHGVIRVGDGKHAPRQLDRIDGGDDAARSGTVRVLRADQHLALRRPAQHLHTAIVKRNAARQAARQRHHIRFLRPLIRSGKGQPLAIARNCRVRFISGMRGQALRGAAVHAASPQVAFGGKHHGIAAHGGVAEIAAGGGGGSGGGGDCGGAAQQAGGTQQEGKGTGNFHVSNL